MGITIEKVGSITLIWDFWDCNCHDNYIHRKTTTPVCEICGAVHSECPDAIAHEVYWSGLMTAEEKEMLDDYFSGKCV